MDVSIIGKAAVVHFVDINGWIARDDDMSLFLYSHEPERVMVHAWKGYWAGYSITKLDNSLYPDLKWSDNPRQVNLKLMLS